MTSKSRLITDVVADFTGQSSLLTLCLWSPGIQSDLNTEALLDLQGMATAAGKTLSHRALRSRLTAVA